MSEPVTARVANGIGAIAAEDWDACAGADNPFLSHAFLSALEDSGSAVARAGWQPVPLVIDGADGRPAGIVPAYAKSHSQGEYVFDHAWAEAWQRAGGEYYPKLQIAVPFTPVPGPRLLLRDPSAAPALIAAIEAMVAQHELSSAHATFLTPEQLPLFEAAGWLIRQGTQFHWHNEGYGTFADFLGALASRKRKAIVKERAAAREGLDIRALTGAALGEAEWDAFWTFYQDTGSRKWGRPYLTRRFFSMLGERMADKVLLLIAYRDGQPIAGALNLIGGDTLYGRHWGAVEHYHSLHFETCYYQGIDYCIRAGLRHYDAGAQGEHKLARGFEPQLTHSMHWLGERRLSDAVDHYLQRERRLVQTRLEDLRQHSPYRQEQPCDG